MPNEPTRSGSVRGQRGNRAYLVTTLYVTLRHPQLSIDNAYRGRLAPSILLYLLPIRALAKRVVSWVGGKARQFAPPMG